MFFENITSLNSFLAGIGCFAGISIGKLLDFTPLKINIKKLLFDPLLITLKKLLLSLKDLVLNQDKNPIIGQSGDSSSHGSQVGQPGGSSSSGSQVPKPKIHKFIEYRPPSQVGPKSQLGPESKTSSGSQVQPNKGASSSIEDSSRNNLLRNIMTGHLRTPKRTPEMLKTARELTRDMLDPYPGESEEAFTKRVKRTESASYYSSKSKNPTTGFTRIPRTREQILADRAKVRDGMFQKKGESDQAFEKRVNNRDSRVNSIIRKENSKLQNARSRKFSTFSN